MLRQSLQVSRRIRIHQIKASLSGATKSFLQKNSTRSSEAKAEQQKHRGDQIRNKNLNKPNDSVDAFADRWHEAVKGRQNPERKKQWNIQDNKTKQNTPKSWRTRLQEKAREKEANEKQQVSDVLSTFLKKRNEQNELEKASLRARSSNPTENQNNGSPIKDMKDVSALRAAFLKTIKNRPNTPKRQVEEEKPEWRQTGRAREYRKRVKKQREAEMRYKMRNDKRKRFFSEVDNDSFFGAKEEMDIADLQKRKEEKVKYEQKRRETKDKQILLPSSPVSVSTLSSVFRVKINELLQMLRKYEYREKSDVVSEGKQNLDEATVVDLDTMELIALDLGLEAVRSPEEFEQRSASEEARHLLLQHRRGGSEENDAVEDFKKLQPRPPVVCIMGHVDHGKTTLMDTLRRKSNGIKSSSPKKKLKKKKKSVGKGVSDDVAGTEAGGITQVISAFQVSLEQDSTQAVTFLDTPGHAAFRKMRESGSNAADVICLVIAADDGVSAQTLEILEYYKSIISDVGTAISLVVAMTKVDKPGINVDESRSKIEAQLMEHGIMPESYGINSADDMFGPPVQLVPVSGMTGEGVDNLIESLTLQTEIMELRANANDLAEGIVMDARVEKGIGAVVDCIIRWGSLKRGDVVVSGIHYGKVKALKSGEYLFLMSLGFLTKYQIFFSYPYISLSKQRCFEGCRSVPARAHRWL